MQLREARELGDRLAGMASMERFEEAGALLAPLLGERTPFRLLDTIGLRLGSAPPDVLDAFLDQISAGRTMGGWVVIASALRQRLSGDLPGAFARCRSFAILSDVWYAVDTFGERLPGPALVSDFEPSLAWLAVWREDPNRWVRRMTGVAVHYWAKQRRGKAEYRQQACALLDLLAPLFSEREVDAVKGIGWGLKTLGRYYPDLAADWLAGQVARPHRALMLRKAITYLPPEIRQGIMGKLP